MHTVRKYPRQEAVAFTQGYEAVTRALDVTVVASAAHVLAASALVLRSVVTPVGTSHTVRWGGSPLSHLHKQSQPDARYVAASSAAVSAAANAVHCPANNLYIAHSTNSCSHLSHRHAQSQPEARYRCFFFCCCQCCSK
jgi:hypothetical protein